MEKTKIFWCKGCLNMSTRPRIEFNETGFCNACQWSEEKKEFDFESRKDELTKVLEANRRSLSQPFDCIVPVSGGKDGSYVAHTLKTKYNVNPLTVTIRPALELDIGDTNLKNFINSGFTHIHITADVNILQTLNKFGFIEKGFPYYGWLIAIHTAVIRTALAFNIPLIFWGEDGEIEYGGGTAKQNTPFYDIDYMKSAYLEGGHDIILDKVKKELNITDSELWFWKFPNSSEINNKNIKFTHWSFYENWDSYRNYVVAKEYCGLVDKKDSNEGTFTNFAQNDQALYSLHAYIMYLKFGFGRATQDAGIEIRRGAMERNQAIPLVKIYDGIYPYEHETTYLEYYDMTKSEFENVLDRYANKDLFEKKEGKWKPKFVIDNEFYL
jgi:N-acetyl sugar amidotransferase